MTFKPESYDKNWLSSNNHFKLPKDRTSINAMARSFATLNPIVSSTINFYSTYPIKFLKFDYSHLDNKLSDFYSTQVKNLNLENTLTYLLKDILLLGESFVYSELSEEKGQWSKLIIQNPDYIIVKNSILNELQYFLRPDDNLRRIVASPEKHQEAIKKLDKKIINHIKNRENIPLDNFYLTHFCLKDSTYSLRGTSFLTPVFQLLLLDNNDQLTLQEKEINLDKIKTAIFYPFNLNNNVTIEIVRQKFIAIFSSITTWLNNKIFIPIGKINDFYEYKNGKKILLIPKVTFDNDNLFRDLFLNIGVK